jgi:hypothetical protein
MKIVKLRNEVQQHLTRFVFSFDGCPVSGVIVLHEFDDSVGVLNLFGCAPTATLIQYSGNHNYLKNYDKLKMCFSASIS